MFEKCYNCDTRRFKCHSDCKYYQEEKERVDEIKHVKQLEFESRITAKKIRRSKRLGGLI